MKLTQTNPYRIAGILANASAKEIQSRKGKITAFANVGKEITSEYDFSFFPPLQRNSTIIDKAFSDIEQNQNKVIHSLFWFINSNALDETAIGYLKNGNKEKAVEIWEKITFEKEVNSKNFSAFNNIGTLYLSGETDNEIKRGIESKIKLIESEYFKDFVHTVADETFVIDTNRQTELFIDTLVYQLIGFIRQHNQHFGSYHWKDSHRARQLLNEGLQQIGDNPNVDDLHPIVRELIGLIITNPDKACPSCGKLGCNNECILEG